jgi:hypothetical protein
MADNNNDNSNQDAHFWSEQLNCLMYSYRVTTGELGFDKMAKPTTAR